MQKGQFRIADKSVWDACKDSPEGHFHEALVLLYLETGPVTNWTGLFAAPPVDIATYTRLPIQGVNAAIKELERRGLIVYDRERQLVYVKGLLLRQMKDIGPTEQQAIGIFRHVKQYSEASPAVIAFIDEHRETRALAKHLKQNAEGGPPHLPSPRTST